MTNMKNPFKKKSPKKKGDSDDSAIDDLVSQLDQKLQVNDDIDAPEELKEVARMIASGNAKKIVVLSGAGVSVAAGIPDFRSPGTGLYDNLQAYNLPYPEAVFDVDFYVKTPQPFVTLAKEIWPGLTHSPTLTHSFLKLLSDHNLLLRNYTQNIDGLEFLAGLDSDKIVECHGHFRTASCARCKKAADADQTRDDILKGQVPRCTKCKKPVKPDIVFFGESLPSRFHNLLQKDVESADLLLVMGTSLQVAPVSMIPQMVNCPRVLLNRELVMDLTSDDDIWVPGNCDDAVEKLCELLGWWDRLKKQNKETRIVSPKKVEKNGEAEKGKKETSQEQ